MTLATLTDPVGNGSLAAASQWMAAAVTGKVTTVIAALAVADIGPLMLTERVPLRRGVTTVAGCFVLFGASPIAAGLLALRMEHGNTPDQTSSVVAIPPTVMPAPAQLQVYDTYAGASLPVRPRACLCDESCSRSGHKNGLERA